MNYPYRFKTAKEFTMQYGREWREGKLDLNENNTRKGFYWNTKMDILLGEEYPFTIRDLYNWKENSYDNIIDCPKLDEWSISIDMLTSSAPNYKPKRFIKEL